MHLVFIPGFAVPDCESYYHAFRKGIGPLHTMDFLQIDGYSTSHRRCLGDISLPTLLQECALACSRVIGPYLLVGHSTGALIVQQLYASLRTPPLAILLLNPIRWHPRLRIGRCLPLYWPLMPLLDLVPIPLITHVFSQKQIGTHCDLAPAMKYRLWSDLQAAGKIPAILPASNTAVVGSMFDNIGNGVETICCENKHVTKVPGHTSFRSMECMLYVLKLLDTYRDTTVDEHFLSSDSELIGGGQ